LWVLKQADDHCCKLPLALRLSGMAADRGRRAGGRWRKSALPARLKKGVESLAKGTLIKARNAGVFNRARMFGQALFDGGAAFGGRHVDALRLGAPEHVDERFGGVEQPGERGKSLAAHEVVGILSLRQRDEAQ
jgi:hypothetical protein